MTERPALCNTVGTLFFGRNRAIEGPNRRNRPNLGRPELTAASEIVAHGVAGLRARPTLLVLIDD
jgi:hypothetical protein